VDLVGHLAANASTPRAISVQVTPAAMLLVVIALAGIALVVQGVFAWFNGARLGAKTGSISGLRAGRARLSGIVEPAWSVVTSPFGHRASVWYDSRLTRGSGRSRRVLFWEINAVPFVLNDGTGRIVVLGRLGRWDASAGHPGSAPFENAADLAAELGRALADPPEPLYSFSTSSRSDPAQGDRRETLLAIGERVTVTGRALTTRAVWNLDACPDAGESLGLSGELVIGPGRIEGLSIAAGTAEDLANRGRIRLLLGAVGGTVTVAAMVALAFVGR
jgi:hypothetical protein